MSDCPCQNCKKRFPGCHDTCKPYIDWHALMRADKEDIRANRYELSPAQIKAKNHYNRLKILGRRK